MARSLNKVLIIGHLGRDPELRYTPSGRAVATFPVATNRTRKDEEGETQEETEWFNLVLWGRLAEIAHQYLTKGRKVYAEGRLQTRSWEDAEGQKRYRTEVVVEEMLMLEAPSEAVLAGAEAATVPA